MCFKIENRFASFILLVKITLIFFDYLTVAFNISFASKLTFAYTYHPIKKIPTAYNLLGVLPYMEMRTTNSCLLTIPNSQNS
jgi:hypothetical protein